MQKQPLTRLTLNRETLRRIDSAGLRAIGAGIPLNDTVYRTQPVPNNDTVIHQIIVETDSCHCPMIA
ncbi:MAG: hypothetical protein M3O15_15290 [Acidobacteriota bacterium]|nr:hypothetical protein [Acidobacteriota bacterium]